MPYRSKKDSKPKSTCDGNPSGGCLSLEKRLLALFDDPSPRPISTSEIARTLGLSPALRAECRRCLKHLVNEGAVLRLRRNRYIRSRHDKEWTGQLRMHPRGFGFVADENHPEREAFIPKTAVCRALHKDRVRISAFEVPPQRRGRSSKRLNEGRPCWKGRILSVLERTNPEVVGIVQQTPYYAYVIPDDPRNTQNIRLADPSFPKRRGVSAAGRKVVVALDPWTPHQRFPSGKIVDDLGDAEDPSVTIPALMRRYRIRESFSEPVKQQAIANKQKLSEEEISGRVDLRDRFVLTIDPESARDFDDAVSIERAPDGNWRAGIHIADVAHFVPPGSDLDREASARGLSTYLVDRTIPMLPWTLTAETCSLQPNRDRLTHSVELTFTADGRAIGSRTFPSVIRSRSRLDYRAVQSFFTNGNPRPDWPEGVVSTLRLMRTLALRLRARRFENGALLLQTPEIQCHLDDAGRVQSIERRSELESYHLIEEFMLQANKAVAEKLEKAYYPSLYRIHEEPDDAQWENMETDLQTLGIRLEKRDRSGLNKILAKTTNTPLAYPAALALLRNFKKAFYAPYRHAHFGLGFSEYTHFTSPIRRYPDLVVHRLLRALEQQSPPPYRATELHQIGLHCSTREREAETAERESIAIKRVEYYSQLLESGKTGPWTATVVAVTPKGFRVEIPDTLQQGLLPFSSWREKGRQSGTRRASRGRPVSLGGIAIGQTLSVRLCRVDMRKQWVDFIPAFSK